MMQLLAAIEHGYWYARSAEFMQQPIIHLLVWMRVPGDTIFSVGALALAWFVLRLWVAPRRERRRRWNRQRMRRIRRTGGRRVHAWVLLPSKATNMNPATTCGDIFRRRACCCDERRIG